MSCYFAVIDLGSNSVRMSVNKVESDGKWLAIEKLRETVRLSEGMEKDGFLKETAMQRVIEALKRFSGVAKQYRCVSIAAIATAAVRTAANKTLFLSRVKEATGIDLKVISGEEEAYYSYLALKETLGVTNGVIFDTGGGSTEITLVKNGQIVSSVSLPLGAVVLTERMAHSSQSQLYRYVAAHIGAIEWIDECCSLPVYAIGGSTRTLAMLCKKRMLTAQELDGLKLNYHQVAKMYQKIFNTPVNLRADMPGMDKARADIILAGLTPAKVLMDMTGSPEMFVCNSGVKEGVFFRLKDEIIKAHEVKKHNEL